MIAIDTNVLLRHLLDDDPLQSPAAHRLFRHGQPVLVTDIVLIETVWTLSGKKFRASRNDIATTIETLLMEPVIRFEDAQAVWRALNDFRQHSALDFPDALLIHKAKSLLKEHGHKPIIYSFDNAALKIAGVKTP